MPAPAAPGSFARPNGSDVELYVHLDEAHENFVKRDLETTATALRSAAGGLERAVENAPAEARQGLLDSAHGLERIERDVRAGAIISIESLDHNLAKANAALARYHYLRAVDAWVARQGPTTGLEMVSAVDQLEPDRSVSVT